MLSKLTFSLASLIVLLMIGLCLPVMAQISQTVNLGAVTDGIPANGHVVFGRSAAEANGIDEGPDTDDLDVTYVPIDADPALQDLGAFFSAGGTVELLIGHTVDSDGGD